MSSKHETLRGEKVRYNLELPCAIDARVQELAEKHNMTRTEVIRTALKFFSECDSLTSEGFQTVSIRTDESGQKETIRHSVH